MKFAVKFAVIFFLVGLVVGLIYFTSLNDDALENDVNEYLLGTLNKKADLVENFLNKQKEKTIEISKVEVFRKFLENPDQRPDLLDEVNSVFLSNIKKDPLIDESFILSPEGDLLVNTQRGYTPPNIFREFDYSVEKEGQAYIKPIRFCYCVEQYVLDVTTPIYSNETGEIIGLIAIRTYAGNIADQIEGQEGLRELERVYLMNSHGLLIASSILFQERQRSFIQNADNENARKCFNQKDESGAISHKGFMSPFLNYLGEEVIGTYKYFSEPDWCLLVEDDVNSIYNVPKRNIFIKNITIITLFIFALSLVGYFIGKRLDKKRNKR
ncbi:MAG: cache domain-containing protein [Nanoarchaeota archaeon]|nr:cache domain-containing protein [Nanoarchaeota archaeon]